MGANPSKAVCYAPGRILFTENKEEKPSLVHRWDSQSLVTVSASDFVNG